MSSPATDRTEPKLVSRGRQRDLLPYRLHEIVEFVMNEAANNDTALEMVIAIVETAKRDGNLSKDIAGDMQTYLMTAFRSNDHMYDVLKYLREMGMEVSQREVERVLKLRSDVKKSSKGVSK